MTVWLCPGQGAQKPGMGADLLGLDEVDRVYDVMSDILDIDLRYLSLQGTEDEINEPEAAQALTMAVSVGVGEALKARGFEPDAVIGFSLGEISGLVIAGILSLEDATRILKVRSRSMAKACAAEKGAMLALLGATLEDAEEICAECSEGDVLVCANHNAPGQIVVSGHEGAVDRAQAAWADRRKKSAKLATAGAFHSELMSSAAEDVHVACKGVEFKEPAVPLVCNTDASPFIAEEAADRLSDQVKGAVLFEQSVRYMLDQGETDFVEVGFGKVLTGLVRKIDKSASRENVGTLEQFEKYVNDGGRS